MLLSQVKNEAVYPGQSQRVPEQRPLSVSEAMSIARGALEGISVRVVGEVFEVSAKAGYKAVYFTLKDARASMPCMMWMNRYRATRIQLQVGMLVELTGTFTLYPPRGTMNLLVDSLSMTGEGELRRRVAQLAHALELEGLMDPLRKRSIPTLPEHVGIVTSPLGDAVHDVLRTFRRRWPVARISFAGVHVEGTTAPAEIVEGLQACADAGCDIILLVRGGGSYESLMPFNDEGLARAVAACSVPVVTGIGHEPDNTIADMVSELRASTPTGAALQVTPDMTGLVTEIDSKAHRMAFALSRCLDQMSLSLKRCASRPVLADAHALFATDLMTLDVMRSRLSRLRSSLFTSQRARLDSAQNSLPRSLPLSLSREKTRLEELGKRLRGIGFTLLARYSQKLISDERRFLSCAPTLMNGFEREFAFRAGRLHDLSPLAVIARGYSLIHDDQGRIVKKTGDVSVGQKLDVTVLDGTLVCAVEDIRPHKIQPHSTAAVPPTQA